MGIRTPLEDFVKTTLASVPGFWQKLLYFGELRKGGTDYDHWGMKQRYGNRASGDAMGAAHTDVFLRMLRTPINTLLYELRASAEPQKQTEEEYVAQLDGCRDEMLPADEGGGSKQHLDVTLRTLEALVRSPANRRSE
jgi:hypothetical protein